MPLTERNDYAAVVAVLTEIHGANAVCTQSDAAFTNYRLGALWSEYLITERGGFDPFLQVYLDSAQMESIYGAQSQNLLRAAVMWNRARFDATA